MEWIKDISDFLKSNSAFTESKEAPGRRYYFIRDGVKIAIVWFKWGLDGWRLSFYNEDKGEDWENRGPIESVNRLKELLSI